MTDDNKTAKRIEKDKLGKVAIDQRRSLWNSNSTRT